MKLFNTLFTACAGAVLATSAWGQTPPPSTNTAPSLTQQFTLPNGLTVIIKPDRRAPTAVHMLWVRVGAMDEVDGTTGVAHVLEHMLFKGTKTLKPGEFSQKVAALGGRENAFTSRDYTGYYQQIPSNKLEDVMKLEADRFANNQWADEEFKKELEVVKEERRMRTEDNPRSLMWEAMNAMTFTASPYRRPIVGWMSDLDAMTPDDARAFYRQWYAPNNAAVVIAGDVDVASAKALVEKYYGGIASRPVPARKPREEPAQSGIRRLDFKAPAEQAYVSLAFKVPQITSPAATDTATLDSYALTVLSAVLDGYSGARLDRALTQGENRVADSAAQMMGALGMAEDQLARLEPQIKLLATLVTQAGLALDSSRRRLPSPPVSDQESLNVSLGELRRAVHEVNNPLTIMKNYTKILRLKWSEQDPAQRDLGVIDDEIDRVSTILKNLVEPETRKSHFKPELVDVNAVIFDLTRLTDQALLTHKVRLRTELSHAIEPIVADRDRLKQILMNLIKNAAEAMPQGGPIVISTTDDVNYEGKPSVEITVQDSGPGIPESVKSRLFQPGVTTKHGDHAGLGLSIVQTLVREIRGHIEYQSSPEQGTTFRIY